MAVRLHDTPGEFLAHAGEVTSRSAASAAFVSAWCAGIERHPPAPGTLVVFATASVAASRALAIQHGPHRVLLESSDGPAAAEIADALAGRGWRVPGVQGAEGAVRAFAGAWCAATGARCVERTRLCNHGLDRVAAVPDAAGAMRPACAADGDWIVEALSAFEVEAGVPPPPQGHARLVAERLAEDRWRIWDDGGAVSLCGANPVGEAARIGPVWTPAPLRGRGYATSLVAHASRERLARGAVRVFLVTDLANPVSNAIYARIGFRPLDESLVVDFVAP